MMVEVLAEAVIERLTFDYGIEFLTDDRTTVRIEGQGVVGQTGGSFQTFDAEAPSAVAPLLLEFLHRPGRLLLDGATLVLAKADPALEMRVGPSEGYEAWSATFSDGTRLVCAGDGEVTRWAGS